MKHKLYTLLSRVVLASMLLGACAAIAPDTGESFNGTVTITFVQEPDNLNPLYTSMYFSEITRELWLKGLWNFDENAKPIPVLAKEIPTIENRGLSTDGKTITIRLRDDITWSDGEPLTADDFVFTYNMIMSERNVPQGRYPYDGYVASVEARDKTTLVVTFNEPFAAWLTTLFDWVLPKHILEPVFDAEGSLDNADWNNAPTVGVGPFVFSEWETDSHLAFKANPNWIEPPRIEQVFIRIVQDHDEQEAAIIAGETDLGIWLSSDQIKNIEADGTVEVVPIASGYNEAWFLNVNPETAHPAMLDVNVRKAIALATDRFTIVKDLLVEDINRVNVTYWDTTPPYQTDTLQPYPYDPEEARKLLDAAGWTDSDGDGIRDKEIDGQQVDLALRTITNQLELHQKVLSMVQQQWRDIGIGMELVDYPSDVFWDGYNEGGPQARGLYEIAEFSSVGNAFPDPDVTSSWVCKQIASAQNPAGSNWQGYCNPELDTLMAEQAITVDPVKRKELYNQIQQIIYDDYVYIGMWKDPDLWSIGNRVKNVKLSGVSPFWNVEEWEAVGN